MSVVEASQRREAAKQSRSKRADVMMFGLRNVVGIQGGIENHVRYLSEHLAKQGLNVEILIRSPYRTDGQKCLGGRVMLTSIWSPRNVAIETIVHSFLAVGYAIVRRPRVLHIHAIGPGLMTPLARLFGIKVVVTHHGKDYDREKWGPFAKFILRAGESFSVRFADEVIAVSRPLAADLRTSYKRDFEFIPNGVGAAAPATSHVTLENLGLEPGKYILNVSRLVPEKRQLDLIEAFLKLNPPDFKLVFVGAADHESSYSQKLRTYAERDPRIVFAGYQQGSALSTLFANAAFFALPSSHEGLPIVALEAMSFRLPLLLSDIPANLALDLPPECYARTGEIDSWVAALESQADSSRKLRTIDWSAWLEPYKWSDVSKKTAQVYEKIWNGETR